jgi:methionine-rich copper-binding protein CopC
MRRSTLAGIVPLLLLLATAQAAAHAFLERADPRVGNKVATPPQQVTLWFTEKLEVAFSSMTVTNAAGQRIVNWHVLSVDTHTTDGDFTFQVGP